MIFEYMGTSYSDLWDKYHKEKAEKDRWIWLAKLAKIHVSGCPYGLCSTKRRGDPAPGPNVYTWTPNDRAITPWVSSRVHANCNIRPCPVLSSERFDDYLRMHPHACNTDPALARETGNCPGMAGHADDIRAKVDREKRQRTILKDAVIDYMYRRGINAFVMSNDEIKFYIDKVNEMDAGDPLAYTLIIETAPKVPGIDPLPWTAPTETYQPTPTPWTPGAPVYRPPREAPTPTGFGLAQISALVRDFLTVEGLQKNWPGIALGVGLFMLKSRKAATT